jgi:SAM-dependent methyltransferase
MRSARDLTPHNPEEERLRAFDLRELDAEDPRSHFALKYRARLDAVLDATRTYVPPGGLILEVGCAQANASLLLAEMGFTTIALDLRPESLSYARRKHVAGAFHPVCANAEHPPFRPRVFDAVILGELLEHCARPHEILRFLSDALRPGGHMIITTPNGQRWGCHEHAYDPDRSEGLQDHEFGPGGEDHLFAFSTGQLLDVVRTAGLRPVYVRRAGSILHCDRIMPLKRLLPLGAVPRLARLACSLPGLGPRTALTLLVVATNG